MERAERLYPISEEKFTELVLPIIEASHRGKVDRLKFPTIKRFAAYSLF